MTKWKEYLNLWTVGGGLLVIAALVLIFGVDTVKGWIEAVYGDATGQE